MEKIPPIDRNGNKALGEEKTQAKIPRRKFLQGVGATVLTSNLPNLAKANVETSLYPAPRPSPEATTENSVDQLKTLTYRAYEAPLEKALRFTATLNNDLELVTERISSLVENDQRYNSVMQLIDDQLAMSMPEPINSALRAMMIYVPYIESRFNNTAISSVRAFGLMQLTLSAWEELSQPDEQKEDISDQVRVAGRLLDQIYRHLMNEHFATFDLLAELLYEGDMSKCSKEFICPLVINGYFSGMGTIDTVLDGFSADYVNEEEKQRIQSAGILTDEMGVYGLFSTAGELHSYSRLYGQESANYVPKIIAAKLVMRTGLASSVLAELMPKSSGVI